MAGKPVEIDALIVGGGAAGLWVLNVLRSRGYSAVLFEGGRLGGEQTLASQGIVHGGLKFALGGVPTVASEAAAQALGRWRDCLAGCGEVDLRGLRAASDGFYLFSGTGAVAKLATFLAGKALRGRVERLGRDEFPAALRDAAFRGWVYRLDDFVLDTAALVARLAAMAGGGVFEHALAPQDCVPMQRLDRSRQRRYERGNQAGTPTNQIPANDCGGVRIRVGDQALYAKRLILAAGAGNEALMRGLGIANAPMQRRPLHQVIVRHPQLPPLFGHWLGEGGQAEPRLTITSHPDTRQLAREGIAPQGHPLGAHTPETEVPDQVSTASHARTDKSMPSEQPWPAKSRHTAHLLWYLGGQLATSGVAFDARAQCRRAQVELQTCFPWMDWNGAAFETFHMDRAEPLQPSGKRPDHAFVEASGACIICWPTKLTLVPDLADRVLELLPPPQFPDPVSLDLPPAELGLAPWEA